mmetsp:Transcript_100410/g.290022  ORF Transcript_100410/g.290022 Transcript_100410/m.290022 type:complete len:289 (-) Transcript_100410:240-1106(-)
MLCAILPKKVLSPVACTTHVALPFSTVVPKNAKLRASVHGTVGFSVFGCRGSGIDSPVSAELSTSMPSVQLSTRTSAGMRSPASRKMMSPGTRFTASMPWSIRSPLAARRTTGTGLSPCNFCNACISSSAICSVFHWRKAVATMMTDNKMGVTISFSPSFSAFTPVMLPVTLVAMSKAAVAVAFMPSIRLESPAAGESLNAMSKSTMATTQHQSRMLKMPQNVILANLTHGFSFCGGVMAFFPKHSKLWRAWSSFKPASPCLQLPSSDIFVFKIADNFGRSKVCTKVL